jgi:hypothetical protein
MSEGAFYGTPHTQRRAERRIDLECVQHMYSTRAVLFLLKIYSCAFRGVTKSAPSLYREIHMDYVTPPSTSEGAFYGAPHTHRAGQKRRTDLECVQHMYSTRAALS